MTLDCLQTADTSYSAGGQLILSPTCVQLGAGRVTAILGPNGAGKSTLLNLLSGQRKPGTGQVRINGGDMATCDPSRLAQLRSVLPQDTGVAFEYTVQDVVELGRYPHRRTPSTNEAGIVRQAMVATDVLHLAHRVLNTLSGGERARAQLARALAQIWEPVGATRWLLLDEPTAALDLSHQHQTMALARHWAIEHGVGVVAVLHDINLAARYADDLLVLRGGQLVASGTVAATLTPELVQNVWGVACERIAANDGTPQFLMVA